jgi:hypothetical protein
MRTIVLLTIALSAAMLAGCVTETKRKTPTSVTVRTTPRNAPSQEVSSPPAPRNQNIGKSEALDSCAEQLHELSGLLLEYYAVYHRLPEKLDDLLPLAEKGHVPATVCPVSHEPYVYDPNGPMLPGAGNVVVYDAKPVHGGMRWGIAVAPPHDNQPLECKIIKVPEAALK